MMISSVYRVVVPARPGTKERARSTKQGVHYTPKQTVVAESWIRLCCTQQVGTPVVPGPVALRVAVFLAPPKMSRADLAEAAALRLLPLRKPDWDNTGKLVADALNGIAWKDDAHVADGRVMKFWCPPGQAPCTIIEWWTMRPGELAGEGAALLAAPVASWGAPAAALALL